MSDNQVNPSNQNQPVPPAVGQPANAGYPQGQPPAPAAPSTNQNAIIAFVLSITSYLFCPIVLAITSLVLARKAKEEIDASNGWSTGSGFVTAAKVLSWINLILGILALLVIIGLLIAAIANPDLHNRIFDAITQSPTATPSI